MPHILIAVIYMSRSLRRYIVSAYSEAYAANSTTTIFYCHVTMKAFSVVLLALPKVLRLQYNIYPVNS